MAALGHLLHRAGASRPTEPGRGQRRRLLRTRRFARGRGCSRLCGFGSDSGGTGQRI